MYAGRAAGRPRHATCLHHAVKKLSKTAVVRKLQAPSESGVMLRELPGNVSKEDMWRLAIQQVDFGRPFAASRR